MSKGAQIRGPLRDGSGVMDEGGLTRAVVGSYTAATEDEAREHGQASAAAVLPLRRRLWALAERLVPERLAAALRARALPADPTGRDGVRELRIAIADWLDPPPVCRWCRRPLRDGDAGERVCSAKRKAARAAVSVEQGTVDGAGVERLSVVTRRPWTPRGPLKCRPARAPAHLGAVARCGTLALYPAGSVDLATMAAALAVPKGAASGYDVAADRDCRALLAATCPPAALPYPVDDPGRWSDEALHRLHAAVAEASRARAGLAGVLPPVLLGAREALQRARDRHLRVNGRIAVGIQRRYHSPHGGVCRADLVQGAAIGQDRAVLDYDAAQARFTTYGANWARQGSGEAFNERDLVGSPPWLLDLRRQVDARLAAGGGLSPLDDCRTADARDLLRAVEALVEAASETRGRPRSRAVRLAHALALELAEVAGLDLSALPDLLAVCAALHEAFPATLTARAGARHKRLRKPPQRRGGRLKAPALAGKAKPPEDHERARERVCGVLATALGLRRASGPGLLAALRHGAPVLVQVGSGGDDDEDTQGTDGAGGSERRSAVLVAPDDAEALADETEDRARWSAILSGLATLRAVADPERPGDLRGAEAAEVVRRHHGLDSVAEEGQGSTGGPVGESFASIGAAGLRCSGRTLGKEYVRKIYYRAIAALQTLAQGAAPDLGDWPGADDEGEPLRPRHPFKPLPPPAVVSKMETTAPPTPREAVDEGAWAAFREAAEAVAW